MVGDGADIGCVDTNDDGTIGSDAVGIETSIDARAAAAARVFGRFAAARANSRAWSCISRNFSCSIMFSSSSRSSRCIKYSLMERGQLVFSTLTHPSSSRPYPVYRIRSCNCIKYIKTRQLISMDEIQIWTRN